MVFSQCHGGGGEEEGRWRGGKEEEERELYAAKSLQSCPTLCDPIDSSPPGFPVPGILQARTLKWVAISSLLIRALISSD